MNRSSQRRQQSGQPIQQSPQWKLRQRSLPSIQRQPLRRLQPQHQLRPRPPLRPRRLPVVWRPRRARKQRARKRRARSTVLVESIPSEDSILYARVVFQRRCLSEDRAKPSPKYPLYAIAFAATLASNGHLRLTKKPSSVWFAPKRPLLVRWGRWLLQQPKAKCLLARRLAWSKWLGRPSQPAGTSQKWSASFFVHADGE